MHVCFHRSIFSAIEFYHDLFLDVPWMAMIRRDYRRMKTKIIEMNIYTTTTQPIEPYDLTTTRISTRVYFFVLILSIMNLIIFTGLQTDIHTHEVRNPSAEIFANLYEKYSSTLQCSCSEISINYGSFVSLSPRYHPICSSAYLSSEWINSIEGTLNNDTFYQHEDFHMFGQSFFLTISVLCSTAQSTLNGAWFIFNHSTLITDNALSKEELLVRTHSALDQFQSNTINEFKRLFALIRIHTKTMLSAKRTNIEFYTRQTADDVEVRFDFRSSLDEHVFFVDRMVNELISNLLLFDMIIVFVHWMINVVNKWPCIPMEFERFMKFNFIFPRSLSDVLRCNRFYDHHWNVSSIRRVSMLFKRKFSRHIRSIFPFLISMLHDLHRKHRLEQ